MKLKLQTATRAEDRSTQKQPTQLNMVAARGRKPAKRPKSSPNLTFSSSSSFFPLHRSECIWSSRLQEREFNLVRSATAALCASRASGISARNRPKHMSKVSVHSSHAPFCCPTAARQTPEAPDKLRLRKPTGEGSEQAEIQSELRTRTCPGSASLLLRCLLSLAQPPLGRASLSEARLHIVEIARVTRMLPDYFRGFSKLIVHLEALRDGLPQSQSVPLVQSALWHCGHAIETSKAHAAHFEMT